MPWNECKRMDERLRFVARILEGENMSALCREFGISRPTGYKFFKRYKDLELEGLEDRSGDLRVGERQPVGNRKNQKKD